MSVVAHTCTAFRRLEQASAVPGLLKRGGGEGVTRWIAQKVKKITTKPAEDFDLRKPTR